MLNLLYSNLTGDFTATANSGAKTITFSSYASTVLSSVISTKSFLGASIKRVNTSGIVDSLPLTNISFSSNVLTLSGMSSNFASGDQVAVVLIGPDKGFDEANDVQQMTLLYQIAGENLLLDVMGTIKKPTVDPAYSGTPGCAIYNDVDIAVKTTPGQLYMVGANNKNAAERFLWVLNKASAPSGDTTFVYVFPLPASSNALITFGENTLGSGGLYLSTGVSIGVSTSATTFTAATTTDHAIVYLYS
jgi:hypothetical protein